MAAAEASAPARPSETVAQRILRFLGKTPVYIFLIVVGLFWLVPTLGLLFTSLLPAEEIANEGWWKVISEPGITTLENYSDLFDNEEIIDSLWTTLWITIGGTVIPIFVAALAGYAFAWIEFPGRDWLFILVVPVLALNVKRFRSER